MEQFLVHVLSALVGSVITSVSWLIARAKQDGVHEERARALGERVAQLEHEHDEMLKDMNRIGAIARDARTMATLSTTGQMPRLSGETPRL